MVKNLKLSSLSHLHYIVCRELSLIIWVDWRCKKLDLPWTNALLHEHKWSLRAVDMMKHVGFCTLTSWVCRKEKNTVLGNHLPYTRNSSRLKTDYFSRSILQACTEFQILNCAVWNIKIFFFWCAIIYLSGLLRVYLFLVARTCLQSSTSSDLTRSPPTFTDPHARGLA